MLLPPDDSIFLTADDEGKIQPPGSTPLVIDKTLPAAGLTLNDYLQYLPSWARKGTSPLRDAYLQTWAQLVNSLWVRFSHVLEAQESPRFAESIWLDSFGSLLGKPRAPGEDDPTYRARLLIAVDVVSPAAIKAAVNTVLSTFAPNSPQNFIYAEPSIDLAFCGPATTADAADTYGHGSRQAIGILQSWTFWTQPQVQTATPSNITIYVAKTLRFWGNDPARTIGNLKYGAFAVPANAPQFWIIQPSALSDDSQMPYEHSTQDSVSAFTSYDFTYGIAGATTLNQSVIAPASTGGSFITPVPCIALTPTSVIDQIYYEVERRRAAGVGWVFFQDLPSSQSF